MSTRRVAPSTPTAPQGLKKSVVPANVPVPSVRTGTNNPEPPSRRYSMLLRYPTSRDRLRASTFPLLEAPGFMLQRLLVPAAASAGLRLRHLLRGHRRRPSI